MLRALSRKIFAIAALACSIALATAAWAQPVTLVVNNNTGATITVFAQNQDGTGMQSVPVVIAPETVGTARVWPGRSVFWAVASRMNPERTTTATMIFNTGITYEIDLFASDFGLRAMFDDPNAGRAEGADPQEDDSWEDVVSGPSMADLRLIEALGVQRWEPGSTSCDAETPAPIWYLVNFVNNCPTGYITGGRHPPGGTEGRWCAYCGDSYNARLSRFRCCVPYGN